MDLIQAQFQKMKNKKGFTLVELIVVIVIIGILAAIIIPRLSGFTDSADRKAVLADARTILTAVSTIYADQGATAAAGLAEGDATLTDLTGPIAGKLTTTTSCSATGVIGFVYELNGWKVTVADGKLGTPTDK